MSDDYSDDFCEDSEEEPAAAAAAAAAVVDPREHFKQTLVAFYKKTDPKYVGKVDYFLTKYLGKEDKILKGLKKKYGTCPNFDLSTLPKPANAGSASAPAPAAAPSTAAKHSVSSKYRRPSSPPTWTKVPYEDIKMGKQIGGGGFAIVYKAKWKRNTVACKLLFDPNVDEAVKKEFMDELNVMTRLKKHPNIIQLLGANNRPPKMFFLMELCEDSLFSLLHLCTAELSERTKGNFLLDIASGMAHMHSQMPPIVHRDLKTQNILVKGTTLKLCDFGLAGSMVVAAGTPSYMAPELFKGKSFTKNVDVYAFAVITWEIFTREIPFAGFGVMDIKHKVEAGERPEFPLAGFPGLIQRLTASAWDPVSANRPSFAKIVEVLTPLVPTLRDLSSLRSLSSVGTMDILDSMI